jgi:hypothetical protein
LPGVAFGIDEPDIEQCVVSLPDGIGRVRLTAVEAVEGLVIGLAAVMRSRPQGGRDAPADVVDCARAWGRRTLGGREGDQTPSAVALAPPPGHLG